MNCGCHLPATADGKKWLGSLSSLVLAQDAGHAHRVTHCVLSYRCFPKPPVTKVTSAEAGLLVSLNRTGCVDLPLISKLYGRGELEIISELGDLIYRDPVSKVWETADAYFSGNVRAKLVQAEQAGPEFSRNALALAGVQPEDVLPGDIEANLGGPWIPASDIRAFACELFGVGPESIRINHSAREAFWSVEADYRAVQSVAATADFGTGRINGTTLLDQALNLKTPTIYDTVPCRGPSRGRGQTARQPVHPPR